MKHFLLCGFHISIRHWVQTGCRKQRQAGANRPLRPRGMARPREALLARSTQQTGGDTRPIDGGQAPVGAVSQKSGNGRLSRVAMHALNRR
jgi:hypothetical protein